LSLPRQFSPLGVYLDCQQGTYNLNAPAAFQIGTKRTENPGVVLFVSILLWVAFVVQLLLPTTVSVDMNAPTPQADRLLIKLSLGYVIVSLCIAGITWLMDYRGHFFVHGQILGAILPFTFFIIAISFFIYARLRLGHFPSYNNPDPKVIGLGLLPFFLCWVIAITVGWATYSSLCFKRAMFKKTTQQIFALTSSLLLWSAFFLVIGTDPFGFLDWLGD
jgi:hypothetical protein